MAWWFEIYTWQDVRIFDSDSIEILAAWLIEVRTQKKSDNENKLEVTQLDMME